MTRISGIDLADNLRVDYALTRIKGIGWTLSKKILGSLKIPLERRISSLSGEEISKISSSLEDLPVEGELARVVRGNISRLQAIGSYRGTRHSRNLPARGQRTRTNARTKRGKRKTVGAFKKEVLSQQRGAKGSSEEAKK
ncbi:30S ribosomal protein S13 [Candidatus Woesebacteria bacterium]|nr:30S ribosomal protein S13 [Candidatus Woesebacteria bacterium]